LVLIVEKRHAANSRGASVGPMRRPGRTSLPLARPLMLAVFCLTAIGVAGAQPLQQQVAEIDEAPRPAAPRKPLAAAFIPLPPRRPADLTPNAPPPAAAPRQSEPSKPSLPPPVALPPIDPSIPPPTLPRASRSAMRRCALEWNSMKRSGHTGPPMWREFATKCLTR
jgi:hypothetical protein